MARSAKPPPAAEENTEDWIATYADAITLLLCFFVILLSISEPKQAKYEEMKKGFMEEFTTEEVSTPTLDMISEIRTVIDQQGIERDVSVEDNDRGVVLEFDSETFFAPGSATLKPEAKLFLARIAEILEKPEFEIFRAEVEGHTDDNPIHTDLFPSNWELSAARASSVVRFFVEKELYPARFAAVGYADTRPKLPNRDLAQKPIPQNQAMNRRVAVVLGREEF